MARAKLEDCEKPPEVDNASVVVTYDENEEFVTATYRCHEGFRMRGKKDMSCDLDTDEWEGNPPSCEAGERITIRCERTSGKSSSRIEF